MKDRQVQNLVSQSHKSWNEIAYLQVRCNVPNKCFRLAYYLASPHSKTIYLIVSLHHDIQVAKEQSQLVTHFIRHYELT